MNYRLIWFQHFHKAAGSSIVAAAQSNNECFWPAHVNGNPLDANGEQLDLACYSAEQLSRFIKQCQQRGVTFVATEWALPNIDVLKTDLAVKLITVVRDPLTRFVSNFYYDLHNGYTPARSVESYVNTRARTFTMDNYYCRILAKIDNRIAPITEAEYLLAKANLAKFNIIASLETDIDQIAPALGWSSDIKHENANTLNTRTLLQRIKNRNLEAVYFQLRYRKKSPNHDFAAHYKSTNAWDYKLLEDFLY